MATYRVRVDLNYDFALELINENAGVWRRLYEKMPKENNPQLELSRFSFATYRITAVSINACKQIVLSSWKKLYENGADLIDVIAIPYEENGNYNIVANMYHAFFGSKAYLDEVTRISLSLPLLKEKNALRPFILQSYLFAIDEGCGFTTMISSLGDYLRKMNVYGESSEKKTNYVEFTIGKETTLGKISPGDVIDRVFELSSDECDYNIVAFDISYFLDGEKLEELRDMAKVLYRLQEDYVFVFKIPFIEKKVLDKISRVLSDVMNLRVLEFPPIHDIVLLERFWDNLTQNGYKPDNSIFELFFEKVKEEKRDGRFYGFLTVEKISNEFIMSKSIADSTNIQNGIIVDKNNIKLSDLSEINAIAKEEKNGYDELSELIGMESIISKIKEIVAQVKISIENEKLDRPCIHMRFLGAPGTGKTTVARIIGKIFKDEGILRKGAFFEYASRALCAEYIGQTAVKTAKICREAYGSVLFIDEAYALYQDDSSTNDYGKEALTTLISEMENHRDDMLVIMAGYTDDMETLMKGNAGLRSRMPYMIFFPNYTRKQLYDIFMLMIKKHFKYDESLEKVSYDYFNSLSDEYLSSKEFANARFVRNLYERTWSKAALRTTLAGSKNVVITKDDFICASEEKEFKEKFSKKVVVGF